MGKKNKRVEAEAEDENDAALNTEQKKEKKKQKKDKKHVVENPFNGIEKESDQVVENASNEDRKKKKKKQKKEKEQTNEYASNGNGDGNESEQVVKNGSNEDGKKKKKKQKKEREQANENASNGNGDGNESEQVVENASNEDGKKKKKKKNLKKQADENASNGNESVKDQVENSYNWDENEVPEGFEPATDRKTIVVRGLAIETVERQIYHRFRVCGFITQIKMSTFSDDGKISRLVFVEFEKEDAVKSALALDGTKLAGNRSLKIEASRIRPKKKDPPAKVNGCKGAYIGNLPRDVDEDDIRQFFKDSKIESIEVVLHKRGKHLCRSFGHIFFTDDESLENAIKKDGMKFNDRPIKVAYPDQKYLVPSKKKGKILSA